MCSDVVWLFLWGGGVVGGSLYFHKGCYNCVRAFKSYKGNCGQLGTLGTLRLYIISLTFKKHFKNTLCFFQSKMTKPNPLNHTRFSANFKWNSCAENDRISLMACQATFLKGTHPEVKPYYIRHMNGLLTIGFP